MLDEQLFGRSLENIFFNSVKYTDEGGQIAMSGYSLEDQTELVFSDDGPGIAEADIPRVFEPFYRGSSSSKAPGTGLGLAIVKSIMETHGFSISVAGKPSGAHGTVITIRIPASANRAPVS